MGVSSEKIQSLQEKAAAINLILLQPDVDLWRLRELALSEGGLVNDTLRRRAWPKLVGLHKFDNCSSREDPATTRNTDGVSSSSSTSSNEDAAAASAPAVDLSNTDHPAKSPSSHLICESLDVEQINRDVARCTWHLLSGTQRYKRFQYKHKSCSKKIAAVLRRKQRRLSNLINVTLVQSYESPADSSSDRPVDDDDDDDDEILRYYQGYHDVASIFLSTLGGGGSAGASPQPLPSSSNSSKKIKPPVDRLEKAAARQGLDLPARVLKQVSFSHFRDAMRSSFAHLQNALRLVLFPLLQRLDPEVHDYLQRCSMEPFFCLSWILTWFSHDVRDTELVKRIFDAFLVSHPLFPLYITVAMILHPFNRQWILSTECDFASLHHVLASLPRNSSGVGWKLRLGPDGFEGYVSDNDEEDEDDHRFNASHSFDGDTSTGLTVSTDLEFSMTSSGDSANLSGFSPDDDGSEAENGDNDDDDTNTVGDMSRNIGPIGCCSDPSSERVPFQDLIDQALVYMKRHPPNSLTKLAEGYYGLSRPSSGDESQEPMLPPPSMELVPSTVLLKPTPDWAVAASAKADWVLKQRARVRMGKKAMSRKDRRRKRRAEARASELQHCDNASVYSANSNHTGAGGSVYGTFGNDTNYDSDDGTVVTRVIDPDYIQKHSNSRAVVASGNGGPGEDEESRRRRRKYRIWANVAVVGVVAISVMAMIQYYRMTNSVQALLPTSKRSDSGPSVASTLSSSTGTASSGPAKSTASSAHTAKAGSKSSDSNRRNAGSNLVNAFLASSPATKRCARINAMLNLSESEQSAACRIVNGTSQPFIPSFFTQILRNNGLPFSKANASGDTDTSSARNPFPMSRDYSSKASGGATPRSAADSPTDDEDSAESKTRRYTGHPSDYRHHRSVDPNPETHSTTVSRQRIPRLFAHQDRDENADEAIVALKRSIDKAIANSLDLGSLQVPLSHPLSGTIASIRARRKERCTDERYFAKDLSSVEEVRALLAQVTNSVLLKGCTMPTSSST